MTLAEGKRKVYMLLDEHSSGGAVSHDPDIEEKMADFFDLAQKDMALHKPIVKEVVLSLTGGTESHGQDLYSLPEALRSVFRIWKDGRLTGPFAIRQGKLAVPHGTAGELVVEYFANPATIGPGTQDTYEFELAEDAAACLPYYVAAQQLISDLIVDYQALWNMYLMHKASVDATLPSSGKTTLRQALFGGR